jgi:hypothetical protein
MAEHDIRVTSVHTEVLVEPEVDDNPVRATSVHAEVLVMPPPDPFPIRVTNIAVEVLVPLFTPFVIDGDKVRTGGVLESGTYNITVEVMDFNGLTYQRVIPITAT